MQNITKCNNSLKNDPYFLKDLIINKVRESDQNSRRNGIALVNGIRPKYPNNIPIKWPPKKEDIVNLFKAINLKISEIQAYEIYIHCCGFNRKEFSFEKLIDWFDKNLNSLEHYDLNLVDPSWLYEN